jgi:hypothetical protein
MSAGNAAIAAIAVAEIVAVPGEQANSGRVLAREDPETVMLDLVNPVSADRRLFCRSREPTIWQARSSAAAASSNTAQCSSLCSWWHDRIVK